MSLELVKAYLEKVQTVLQNIPPEPVAAATRVLIDAHLGEKTIFVVGNGGSAATSSHFVCDLAKGTINGSGKRCRAISLNDNMPLLTAYANDVSYDDVFSGYLQNLAGSGDVLVAFSGSGNSPNIIKALRAARQCGATTIGVTGFEGGQMRAIVDHCIVVPSNSMQHIEDAHMIIAHVMFLGLCLRVNPTSPYLAVI